MTRLSVPQDETERLEWIKYQLRLRGSSLSALARELGVTRHATRLALIKPYPKMERAIAAKLELRPDEIWPERYESGRPNRTPGRPNLSRRDDTIIQARGKGQSPKPIKAVSPPGRRRTKKEER